MSLKNTSTEDDITSEGLLDSKKKIEDLSTNFRVESTTKDGYSLIHDTAEEQPVFKPRSNLYNIGFGLITSTAGIYFGYFQSIFNPIGESLLKDHFQVEDVNGYLGNINLFFP